MEGEVSQWNIVSLLKIREDDSDGQEHIVVWIQNAAMNIQ